jgi:3'-phosphoadenosine 5'-phosphosulfate sulfotransferase (PAPS reductase)/FAD synthetase
MRSNKVLAADELKREQKNTGTTFQSDYDKYIVAFSGGKDSISCFLHLLEIGIPVENIELWHHDIDGHGDVFMDWECTPAYCRAFAAAFNVPIYFSWKEGGFKREMLRENALTAPTSFETPVDGVITVGGTAGKLSTRLKFPQVSPDLSVRWCSAYLKIDVGSCAVRNQDRFRGIKTCFVSGERGEESAARAKYADLEIDRSDNRDGKSFARYVDRWRPIKGWLEKDVWGIIERWRIRLHPAYYMGWSRLSCKICIFGDKDQMASANVVSPVQTGEVADYEELFGVTIKRNMSMRDLLRLGKPYEAITPELTLLATSFEYNETIILDESEYWVLPAGAYGHSCGPM